jgi:putative alpha-1,2-mannosidase
MTSAMLLTMVLCFALTISVAVAIGLAALVGIQVSNVNMLVAVKEMFSSINKFPLAAIPFSSWPATSWSPAASAGVWWSLARASSAACKAACR